MILFNRQWFLAALAAVIFWLATPASAADPCGCHKRCFKKGDPASCERACLAGCQDQAVDAQTITTGKLSELSDDELKRMSIAELEDWRKQYLVRKEQMEKKCETAHKGLGPNDADYRRIRTACQNGLETILQGLTRIAEELAARRKEAARQTACTKDVQSLSDQDYCTALRCGDCVMLHDGRLVPAYKYEKQLRKIAAQELKKSKTKGAKAKGTPIPTAKECSRQEQAYRGCMAAARDDGDRARCEKIHDRICVQLSDYFRGN
jgi:hypothetical protein